VNGIDPSLFFDDDGHVYVVNNGESPDNKPLYNGHRALWLQEIDLNSGQVIGPQKIIVNGGTDLAQKPVWIEGPHLFKKDGFYYLIAAEGGTGERHSEVVFRSQQIWGPYEPWKGNPILTQRDLPADRPNPITCTGHADFVELADGQWWAVFLGCRPYEGDWYNTGRETFLLPVQWKDGWPIILEHGQPIPRALARPNLPIAPIAHPSSRPASTLTGSFDSQDDFTDPTLSPQWMFLRTPTQHWFEISDQSLRLEPRPVSLTRRDNPSFIGRRQQHAAFSVEVTIRIELRNQDADAGLVAFQNETHHLFAGVRISGGSAAAIFLETINEPETQWKTAEPQVIAELLLNTAAQNVRMRISATGRSHEVHYRLDNGGDWLPLKTDLDGSFLSTSVAEGFQGVMLGMFARSVQ
jgi:alpha-N-arabinofuranosidase